MSIFSSYFPNRDTHIGYSYKVLSLHYVYVGR
nr:MAG TPA: hypothetical protein [Caudoviricetes sp.]